MTLIHAAPFLSSLPAYGLWKASTIFRKLEAVKVKNNFLPPYIRLIVKRQDITIIT